MINYNSNFFLAVLTLSIFYPIRPFHQEAENTKPNIVFIMADDLGYGDLGCYGSSLIKTPNLDQLAYNGIRFSDFYAGSTVCAPSRASLMTGQHNGHSTIRGNGEVPLLDTDSIIPQYLHNVGYKNGMVGKWGLGKSGTSSVPENKGWDFFSGHLHHVEGHFQNPDSAWQLLENQTQKIKIPQNKFANEWFKDEAIQFINQNKNNAFFLYVSFTLPHAELIVPQQYLQLYLDKNGKSKFEPEVSQKSALHYGQQQYPKAAYAAMITQMDAYIGEIVAHLKKLQLDKNTIVIFTSDNGTHVEGGRNKKDVAYFKSSGPLRGVKRDLYEGGIRVPFIVNWKNKIIPSSTCKTSAAFWDILPTINEIIGIKRKMSEDGISFLPSLLKKPQQQHEFLYWEFYESGFKQAVRKENWKAIRFFKGKNPEKTVLFNLDDDMGETNDVASQNPEIINQIHIIMNREHISSSNPLFQIK
jgi:arylsulfatase A-like enzyme